MDNRPTDTDSILFSDIKDSVVLRVRYSLRMEEVLRSHGEMAVAVGVNFVSLCERYSTWKAYSIDT